MFRSLHMKLVLIMVLLIVSLMTVVGAFLVNSVAAFYVTDFYEDMASALNAGFRSDLEATLPGETDPVAQLQQILEGSAGRLGVDGQNRNYFLRDGTTGSVLAASSLDSRSVPRNDTHNLLSALNGEEGLQSDVTADYMDVAIPFTRGGVDYIVQIYDTKEAAHSLNAQIIELIVRALFFGLLISVLLSFLLSKTMITPIERLTEGAERVAEGDFSHKITVASRDEIGVLTGTFNAMARQLKETLQEVERERNKLDTLFIHMTDGVVAFSREGAVIHANPAAREMLARDIAPGGAETYNTLFGDIAPLSAVLCLEQPGYLEGERETGGRSLELLLAPFAGEAQGGWSCCWPPSPARPRGA